MANKHRFNLGKNKTEEDILVDVGEVYSKTERFVDQNRSSLTMAVGVLAALILGFVGYEFFIQGPAEAEAESAAWKAENYFEIDSMNLAQLGDGYYGGLEEVMLDHEGTAAGQRAAYRMGIVLRDAGDYEGAIEAFQKVDVNDNVIQVLATGNVGDCYVELTDYEAAAVAFDEAVDLASSSLAEDVLAPMFLYKGALVQIELGNNGAAKTMLDRIVNDYPKSQQNNASEALAASLSEG